MKPKPIVAHACTFSRALSRLRVNTSSFDWFTELSPSFLIGQSNYFGFGFNDTRLKLALNDMEMLGTTHFNPKRFELGSTLIELAEMVYCLFSCKSKYFSDADGDWANVGHFRVHVFLYFKASLSAKFFFW